MSNELQNVWMNYAIIDSIIWVLKIAWLSWVILHFSNRRSVIEFIQNKNKMCLIESKGTYLVHRLQVTSVDGDASFVYGKTRALEIDLVS